MTEAAENEARRGDERAPRCERCGEPTTFAGGAQTHDLYAERFVCVACGAEMYRSYGRGSV